MFITVTTMVARTFTPPEAHRIAAEFRHAANQVRNQAGQLQSGGATLQGTWLGTSKGLFYEKFDKEPPLLHSLADWLNDRANFIESLKVTVYEPVQQQIPVNG